MEGNEDLYVLNGYGSLEDPAMPQPNVLYRNDRGVFTPITEHPLVRDVTFSGSATCDDPDGWRMAAPCERSGRSPTGAIPGPVCGRALQ